MEYGYCRISTPNQNIERQVRNIKKLYPNAHIVKEVYTGTKFQGRKEFDKILRLIKDNDTIIFDSVSRMSRTADEGFEQYKELFNQNINLVFLKEPHINTATYKQAIDNQISITMNSGDEATDDLMKAIIEALNKYILLWQKDRYALRLNSLKKRLQICTRGRRRGWRQQDLMASR